MEILAGVILLGILITFHELGHFLFAKALGVRVLVFSVGFGPKLFGIKKGDTEYRLSAIPLGGYVRMFGESMAEDLSSEEKKMSFMHQPIWRKSLIAFAGPLFNFILPVILFFFLLIGTEQIYAPKVGTLIPGGAADKAGLLPDDLITSVNNKPVESFNEVASIIANHPNVDVKLHIKRTTLEGKHEDLEIIVKPEGKSSTNPLEKDQTVGRIGIMPAIELPMVVVSEHSPLAHAGLRNFDVIENIDGIKIDNARTLKTFLAQIKPGSHLTVKDKDKNTRTITVPSHLTITTSELPIRIKHHLGDSPLPAEIATTVDKTKALLKSEETVLVKDFGIAPAQGAITELNKGSVADDLDLSVGDRLVSVDGEKFITALQLQHAVLNDIGKPHVLGVIKSDGSLMAAVFTIKESAGDKINLDTTVLSLFGIATADVFKPGDLIKRSVGPFEAIKRACVQTADIAFMTGKSLWLLVKREVPASQIGGPIMLFDVAQQAAKKGLSYYIFIMCLLSVNLGLLNLLPIPALDGGHLLLFGIEAVQRKPLTEKTRAIATQIGIAFLLALMAFAIWNDISRLFG